jgi:hypothetical protein
MGNLPKLIADDFTLIESSEKKLQDRTTFGSVNTTSWSEMLHHIANQNTYLRGWISIHILLYIHMHVQLAINDGSKLAPIRHKYWKYYL